MADVSQEAPPSRGRAWLVAVVATLVMTVSYIDRQVLAALATSVKTELGLDHTQYGLLMSAFSITYLVGAPLSGILVDRIGARRGLVIAVLAWSAVAAGHAAVTSFAVLFTLRIALGAAESPSFPGAAQVVRRILPAKDQAAGFGLLFTGSSIGAMIAAPLAIAFKTRFGGWREAFIGTALVGLAWVPLFLLTTRPKAVRAALTPRGAATLEAVPRAALLRDPAVLRAMVLVLGSAPGVMFVLLWAPQYLQRAFHVPEDHLGPYLVLPPLFFDLGAVLFGVWASRRAYASKESSGTDAERSPPSHGDLVIIAACLQACLAFAPLAPSPAWGVAVCSVCLAGGGALYARLTADMLARVSPAHVSTAGGLTAAAQSLTHIVANPIIGKVIDRTHSYDGVTVTLGLVVLPAAVAWVFWPMESRVDSALVGERTHEP